MYLDKRNGTTGLLDVPWARKNSGFTLLFEMKSLELLKLTGCKSAVARYFDIYPQRVETIYNCYTRHAYQQREPLVAHKVGLDETSTRKGHDYISVFWDMEQDRLLDLRPGKSSAVIDAYVNECSLLGQHPRRMIKEIVCDMSPAFSKGIREQLPTTQVTFDRFHVVQLIHRYLQPLKRSKTIDHTRLYAYIDELDHLWEQPDESAAAAFLKYWMDRGEELFGLRRLRKSIDRHFTGIVAYCRTHLTNGKLEGINNKIQWIKRAARGYRTKENFMRMVWFMFTPQTLTHQPIP
jgi:transposase